MALLPMGGLYVTDALGETKIDLERVVTNTYRENAAYILGYAAR